MRKISIIAAISAATLALLSSCDEKNESKTSSSDLVSNNFVDSYILLSANDEMSDSELDEAALILGRRANDLQIMYRTYVDYDSDSVRIDFKYEDNSAEELLETIADKNIIEFRKGSDYSSGEPILDNNDIDSAEPMMISGTNEFLVSVKFNEDGCRKFDEVTGELVGTDVPLSIWFDGELISAPLVNTRISNGNANISGNFDLESASDLAKKISSEPLKYDFSVTEHEFETAYK